MSGRLIVITGPMFSGKTTALINHLTAYKDVLAVTPDIDDRYGTTTIATHDGRSMAATVVPADHPEQILDHVTQEEPPVVGIDEANFFTSALQNVVTTLRDRGSDVVAAGLDTDFCGEPFEPVPKLIDAADAVTRLTAECNICGGAATRTQRLIDGDPAPYDSPQVVVGGAESYTARCEEHHEVPGRKD